MISDFFFVFVLRVEKFAMNTSKDDDVRNDTFLDQIRTPYLHSVRDLKILPAAKVL